MFPLSLPPSPGDNKKAQGGNLPHPLICLSLHLSFHPSFSPSIPILLFLFLSLTIFSFPLSLPCFPTFFFPSFSPYPTFLISLPSSFPPSISHLSCFPLFSLPDYFPFPPPYPTLSLSLLHYSTFLSSLPPSSCLH